MTFPLRKHLPGAGVVCLLALGVRLLFLLTAPDRSWPHAVNYEGDAVIWARAAWLFAQGEVPDDGVPHRFYAIAHLIHWLGGAEASSFLGFKIGWCLLSALSCAAAYLMLRRNLPARPALVATALGVFSFGSYVLATSLNVEGLYAPLLPAILACTLELVRKPSWLLAAGLSVLHGLALLAREEHLVLLLLLSSYVVWQWWQQPRSVGARAVLRRAAFPTSIVAGAILLCLPYSISATRATVRYNTVPKQEPRYTGSRLQWQPDAIAFIESLPAFVRGKTVDLVSRSVLSRNGASTIGADEARRILIDFFGYLPDPLSTPVFIASHGPMSFALANHPDAGGGFSRAALETAGQRDPRLNLTLPTHLRIFNHGYAVGWSYIDGDKVRWLANVGRKLGHAYQGVALGFGAYNFPLGRFGERRPCDLLTPAASAASLAWQLLFAALLLTGSVIAWRHPLGRLCLLVVAYKAVIVILYYGYARQAVSILPVLLVLVALGIDHLLTCLGGLLVGLRFRLPGAVVAGRRVVGAVATIALLLVEVHAGFHPRVFEVAGTIRPLPQWGTDAFSANTHIQIQPVANLQPPLL